MASNPFNWPLAAFLLGYGLLALVSMTAFRLWLRLREARLAGDPRREQALRDDPYALAALRGGDAELVRLVLFRLLDGEQLRLDPQRRLRPAAMARDNDGWPIEREVAASAAGRTPAALLGDSPVLARLGLPYHRALLQAGWLPAEDFAARAVAAVLIAAMVGLAALRAVPALLAGDLSGWLLVAAAGSFWVFLKPRRQGRTRHGQQVLAALQARHDTLRHGVTRRNRDATQLLWIGALFGLDALPISEFPALAHVKYVAAQSGAHASGGDGGAPAGGGTGEGTSAGAAGSSCSDGGSGGGDGGGGGCD